MVKTILDGFLLAFLNPKIAVFFLALFSSCRPGRPSVEKVGMALLAGTIDTAWYLVVALLIGGPALSRWLEARRTALNRLMGDCCAAGDVGLHSRAAHPLTAHPHPTCAGDLSPLATPVSSSSAPHPTR